MPPLESNRRIVEEKMVWKRKQHQAKNLFLPLPSLLSSPLLSSSEEGLRSRRITSVENGIGGALHANPASSVFQFQQA